MIRIEQTVLVTHSAQRMFELVDNVVSYPEFLPWCGGADIKTSNEAITEATIKIDFHGLKQSFTTRNEKTPFTQMKVALVDGPFKHLQGYWRFHPLSETACKVELELEYEFASKWLEKIVGPVFSKIATTLVDAFVKRAEALYGSG